MRVWLPAFRTTCLDDLTKGCWNSISTKERMLSLKSTSSKTSIMPPFKRVEKISTYSWFCTIWLPKLLLIVVVDAVVSIKRGLLVSGPLVITWIETVLVDPAFEKSVLVFFHMFVNFTKSETNFLVLTSITWKPFTVNSKYWVYPYALIADHLLVKRVSTNCYPCGYSSWWKATMNKFKSYRQGMWSTILFPHYFVLVL